MTDNRLVPSLEQAASPPSMTCSFYVPVENITRFEPISNRHWRRIRVREKLATVSNLTKIACKGQE
jgi:hypothetical protein